MRSIYMLKSVFDGEMVELISRHKRHYPIHVVGKLGEDEILNVWERVEEENRSDFLALAEELGNPTQETLYGHLYAFEKAAYKREKLPKREYEPDFSFLLWYAGQPRSPEGGGSGLFTPTPEEERRDPR